MQLCWLRHPSDPPITPSLPIVIASPSLRSLIALSPDFVPTVHPPTDLTVIASLAQLQLQCCNEAFLCFPRLRLFWSDLHYWFPCWSNGYRLSFLITIKSFVVCHPYSLPIAILRYWSWPFVGFEIWRLGSDRISACTGSHLISFPLHFMCFPCISTKVQTFAFVHKF